MIQQIEISCPICRCSNGDHKMGCQNAAYVNQQLEEQRREVSELSEELNRKSEESSRLNNVLDDTRKQLKTFFEKGEYLCGTDDIVRFVNDDVRGAMDLDERYSQK